ncbi:MAG: efflux RND transporter permease subunit [Muribaculaceae bacterium]
MIDFGKWAFGNKKLINFIIAILVVGGIYSCYTMSKLEDPEIKVKLAMIVTTYPGASAHQVELEVTDPLEKSIRTMSNVDAIDSWSYNDLSIIQVELKSTVKDADVEQHWDMLRRKVSNVQPSLPSGASVPTVKDDFGNVYGIFYALTSDGLSDREMSKYAELVKREVNALDGVERTDIYGTRPECINITLLQDKMANLGVKPLEVLATLSGQIGTNYSGYFDNGDNRIRVTVGDKFTGVEQISQMIIQGHDDDRLRLCDIAKVEESYAEPVRNELLYDGEKALGILIAASSGTDIIKVGDSVEKCIDHLRDTRFPTGVECHKVFFQPERVGASLGTFVLNLIESVAIVIVVLMIFMGIRSGIIIGISLVLIVLGSLTFLAGLDGTMQRVSLGALILAMGMLVDNAIVIIDGILVGIRSGKPRMEALTAIGKQTAMPLLGATLIAILAFLPIFLSPDTAGVYVRDLFIVLAVSLMLSWVLALVHVPLMGNRYLKFPKADETKEGKAPFNSPFYLRLEALLRFGLRHRISVVCVIVALLALSGVAYKFVRHGFFPDMTYDQLYMEYKLPEGTNSTRVRADLDSIRTYLMRNYSDVTHVTTSIGGTPGRYNLVRSIANPSLAYGELIIDFTSPRTLNKHIGEIQHYVETHYPDAYVKLKKYNLMFKKYPIEAVFCGPDPAVLHQLADSARRIMEQCPDVTQITSDWEPEVPVLKVDYDQAAARMTGLSRNDVSMSLLAAAGGVPVGKFYEGIDCNTIYLKSLASADKPVENLENVQVFSQMPSLNMIMNRETLLRLKAGTIAKDEIIDGLIGSTPLKQLSRGIDIAWEDPVVVRHNCQRAQRVQSSPRLGLETEGVRRQIAGQIESIPLPHGYSLVWQGEREASSRSMKYLFMNLPLAVILMVTILLLLFKDYRKPAIILCSIPTVIIGVMLSMLITGKTFDFVAIVGTLGLVGMIVKNGIVLMDEISLEIASGIEPTEALIASSKSRLRPVMMASLTTILGMIPLLPDAMFGSMAAAIMGGLLVGSVMILVFIPVLYALFFKLKVTK